MPEYGQGMVRPGVWSQPGWSARYVDRQWQIAKSLEALHTDLRSYWDTHSWESLEDRATLSQMYVSTSTDFQTAWLPTGTSVWFPLALRVVHGPLPAPCMLCDAPNPHVHDKPWRESVHA